MNAGEGNRPLALFLTPHVPNPNGSGAEKRAWMHLSALAKDRSVLMAIVDWGQRIDKGSLSLSHALAVDIMWLSAIRIWDRHRHTSLQGSRLFRALFGSMQPDYLVNDRDLKNLRASVRFDLIEIIFIYRVHTAVTWFQLKIETEFSTNLVIDFDDIDSIFMKREIAVCRQELGCETELVYRLGILRRRLLEAKCLKQASVSLVCSQHDRQILNRRAPNAKVAVVPNGISLHKVPISRRDVKVVNILFLGTLSYAPNEDGIFYFCHHIFPMVKTQWDGEVALNIVGFRPNKKIYSLNQLECVNVVGEVRNVGFCYEQSDLIICPIRFGGGTRVKIIEAMSFSRPVISTSIGAEGIDVTPDVNILIGDTATEFAQACLRLMGDEELRRAVGEAGYNLVARKYNAIEIQNNLREIIDEMVKG